MADPVQRQADSDAMRKRVTKGWTLRTWTVKEMDGIKKYLATGDPDFLVNTSYQWIRNGMYARGER